MNWKRQALQSLYWIAMGIIHYISLSYHTKFASNCSGNPRSGELCAHLASHRLLMTGGHCWTEDTSRSRGRRGDSIGDSRGGKRGVRRKEKGQGQRVSMSTGTCAQNIVNKMQEGEEWERQQSRGNRDRDRDSAERQGDRARIHGKETGRQAEG